MTFVQRTSVLLIASLLTSCGATKGPPTSAGTAQVKDENDFALRKKFIGAAMYQVMEMEKGAALANPPPMIVPFGDWDFYYLDGTLRWKPNPGQAFKPVRVPKGFVTDLASIPRPFWIVLRPEGRYAYAAIVHDYLYWRQDRRREEADQIFEIAMQDSGVSRSTIAELYSAVRGLGGQAAWDTNARLKKAGEHRRLKKFPPDFRISWNDWKKQPGVFADE